MNNIQNVIFDLGGVILNINPQKTIDTFQDMGLSNFEEWCQSPKTVELFMQFETGKINKQCFFQTFNELSKMQFTNTEITSAWNAMLGDFPLRRLQILQQLQMYYDLFLLSNTNEVHAECFNEKINKMTGYSSVNYFFHKTYLSHKLGLRKPDVTIFETILSENHLIPEQTLFIDDLKVNTKAAEKLGIQTIWLKEGMTMEEHVFRPRQ